MSINSLKEGFRWYAEACADLLTPGWRQDSAPIVKLPIPTATTCPIGNNSKVLFPSCPISLEKTHLTNNNEQASLPLSGPTILQVTSRVDSLLHQNPPFCEAGTMGTSLLSKESMNHLVSMPFDSQGVLFGPTGEPLLAATCGSINTLPKISTIPTVVLNGGENALFIEQGQKFHFFCQQAALVAGEMPTESFAPLIPETCPAPGILSQMALYAAEHPYIAAGFVAATVGTGLYLAYRRKTKNDPHGLHHVNHDQGIGKERHHKSKITHKKLRSVSIDQIQGSTEPHKTDLRNGTEIVRSIQLTTIRRRRSKNSVDS